MFLPQNVFYDENKSNDSYDVHTDASDQTLDSFSPILTIPQLDGVSSPPAVTNSPIISEFALPFPPNPSFTHQLPTARARNSNYTLDRNKQIKKLRRDTAIDDFDIVVSKNKQNVNIVCNTGFYTKIAVPALQSLTVGHEKLCDGVTVQCQDIIGNFDATHAQQATVMYFRLSQNKVSLGGVRIHLHHTNRKLQLQGGAILPDKRTAPVWFVDTVLRSHFTQLSHEKSMDISNFNQAVSSMVTSHLTSEQTPHICGGCKIPFNGRSSPELCSQCGLYFHKFKCFPSPKHECYIRKRTQSCNSVPEQDCKLLLPFPLVAELHHLPTQLSHNCHQLPASKNCQPHKTHL